jgi:hypothetical protein
MKLPPDWLRELEMLAWRFAHLGIGPDLAGTAVADLAAMYVYLARLAAGER